MNAFVNRMLPALTLAFAAALAPLPAAASPLPENEAADVRKVVIAQIEALADDDADRVFATTTPAVREAVGTSGRFLAMVRGAYPMVYRPRAVSFHKAEKDDDTVLQMVEVTDQDNKSWLAVFVLEKQPDTSWAIGGCAVVQNPWLST
jgi:hypothetical protein